MQFRKVAAVLVGAALISGGLAIAVPAVAAPTTYGTWVEKENTAPLMTTDGLVFYQSAQINFGHGTEASHTPLVKLADVTGLAYSVAESAGYLPADPAYAPSYQLVVRNATTGVTYARLVWEPSTQTPAVGLDKGVYTGLENGLWWGKNIWSGTSKDTFSGEGSQSSPQPLQFFKTYFGADAQVDFFSVQQGTGTPSISTVTSLTFGGQDVPLGNADATQYNGSDVAAAVKAATDPLQTKLDTANAASKSLQTKLDAANAATKSLQAQLDAAKAALTQSATDAMAKLIAAQNDTTTAQAKLVSISGTKRVGETITAKRSVAISGATATYQWTVGGKVVKNATKSTLKLTKSQAGKSLSVKVTTTWTDGAGKAHSVAATAKYLRTAYIAK